jgi:hypothetical protein
MLSLMVVEEVIHSLMSRAFLVSLNSLSMPVRREAGPGANPRHRQFPE